MLRGAQRFEGLPGVTWGQGGQRETGQSLGQSAPGH